MNWGNLLFSYEGRINRAKYWLAILVYVIVTFVGGIIGFASGSEALANSLSGLISLATFISGILVGIKRLHDRDKSGWWLLLFYILPGVLFTIGGVMLFFGLVADSSGLGGASSIFFLGGAAVLLWAFIELGCLRGTVGPNQYGPDPLAPQQVAAPV
jgi:uncharacterized membrane protein YhaH (DUF805 family)